jgi:hypothetical protein
LVFNQKGIEVQRQAEESASNHLESVSSGIDRSLDVRSAFPKVMARDAALRAPLQRMGASETVPFS